MLQDCCELEEMSAQTPAHDWRIVGAQVNGISGSFMMSLMPKVSKGT